MVMLWFYATPVIYPVDMIPQRLKWATFANPMAPLIICWRSLFMGTPLSFFYLGQAAAWAVLIFMVGLQVYKSLEWRFAEIV